MAEPTTTTSPPKAPDVQDGPQQPAVPPISFADLERFIQVIRLVFAWHNRRERGSVLPLAEELKLIPAEDHETRTEKVNALNALLTTVPPPIAR